MAVIGSCSMDITLITPHRPAQGETVIGTDIHISPGGKGANQAVAAARLGATVYMVGCIGSDMYGEMIRENLSREGINVAYLAELPDEHTGTAYITLADGDNSIIVMRGANNAVTVSYIESIWHGIADADLVLLQNEIPLPTIQYIIDRCDKEHIDVLLNPAPMLSLAEVYLDKVRYITPNEHELELLYPGLNLEAALQRGKGRLLVTQGAQGVAYWQDGIKTAPAYRVEAVDTTGAGDTFNGAFAAAILQGQDLESSIRFGNAAASLSVQKLGAQGGMPHLEAVREVLK